MRIRKLLFLGVISVFIITTAWLYGSGGLHENGYQTIKNEVHEPLSKRDSPPKTAQIKPSDNVVNNKKPSPPVNGNPSIEVPLNLKEDNKAFKAFKDFNDWLSDLGGNSTKQEIAEGIALAKVRKPVIQSLIRTNPKKALSHAVTLKEYASLPEEVALLVEKPFSELARLSVLPNESKGSNQPSEFTYLITKNGERSNLFRYGKRASILSKKNLPSQGISLDNEVVISDQVLQVIPKVDFGFYKDNFPTGSINSKFDAYTGEKISHEPVAAIAGGHLFYFANRRSLDTLNEKLAELEQVIGPNTGSQLLFPKSLSNGGGSDPLNSLADSDGLQISLAALLASPSNWTTTKKTVFFIRVNFPDNSDPVVSKAVLESTLDNQISDLIKDMSKGKTWLESDVSDAVVTLPSSTATYKSGEQNDLLHSDAVTAFNNLSTGVDLNGYDIVGVYFNDIELTSSGFHYGGLADLGGDRQWLQGSYDIGLVTHEFGHNYGLLHSNSWNTTDGSSVGSGFGVEYGDVFDIMGYGADYGGAGHFHPQGSERLDWLDSNQWQDVTASGQHRIYRFDHKDALGLQSLRIPRDNNDYYWLGYRKNFTDTKNGAYVIWQRPSQINSWLVDTTPDSVADDYMDNFDAAVQIGNTYSDTSTVPNIHITPLAKGGDTPDEWMDIRVNVGSFTSNQAPSVTITGPSNAVARQFVTFSAAASDPDNDELAYAWDFGDGDVYNSQPTIHKSWLTGGSYTVKLTVSDMKGGVSTTSTLNVTVTDPLTNWYPRASGESNPLVDIATDGNMAIAITNFAVLGTSPIPGSSNGAIWNRLDERRDGSTGLGYNTYLRSVTHNGTRWVAVGQDYDSGWKGAVYTSTDGINWTERFLSGNRLWDVVSAGNVMIAVGDAGFAIRSTDGGLSWSPVATGAATKLISVGYGNSKFIAVGNKYIVGDLAAVFTSADGQTWTDNTTNAGIASSNGYNHVEFLGNKFLGSGYNSAFGYHDLSSAAEFETAGQGGAVMPALMHGNGIYFAAGIKSGADANLFSLDGVTWSSPPSTPSTENRNAGVFFKDTFITVGNAGTIYQSGLIQEADTDGDGTPDSSDSDDDGDGISDAWEIANGLNPLDPSDQYFDPDQDGLSNLDEYLNGTNPNNPDTDGDGMNDGDEVAIGRNPVFDQTLGIMPVLDYLLLN